MYPLGVSTHNLLPFLIQDYINERVRRIGGYTCFNLFILRELEILYDVLAEIKNTLTVRRSIAFIS